MLQSKSCGKLLFFKTPQNFQFIARFGPNKKGFPESSSFACYENLTFVPNRLSSAGEPMKI